MADNLEVISYIRYQLDQLSAKNGHHEFEQICRHLARISICSNILPATGPVSAGGDQGRDFETYATNLKSTPMANSTFLNKVSDKPIVFSCTIQRKNIVAKIKLDINTIMAKGTIVDAIYYFCTSDIDVALRHRLQDWVKEKYNISFELFDGQAISELLAIRETFWIAQRFLSVPSEIYPRSADEESWYSESLAEWQSKKPNMTFADFYEIKTALRHATFCSNVKQDLPFWINLMEVFLGNTSPYSLKRKAIYEISVASLRGLGTLIGQEENLRDYFSKINNLCEISDLEDAACALNYCTGAIRLNLLQITPSELEQWRDVLTKRVDEMLNAASTPSSQSPLLELRGYLSLFADSQKMGQISPEEAIKWWTKLTVVAKNAPLFPLERFADRLTQFIKLIGDHPKFENLAQKTDSLLQKRYGNIKAAEKCRDRAIAFYEKGNKLKAINQLHQAKVKWFVEETLEASSLSMLIISECYRELGLSFAAKYYALAAAHISLNPNKPELKKLVSRSLIRAAECDYAQGCWCGFLELIDTWIKTYSYFSHNSNDESEEFTRFLFDIATLITLTKKLDSRLDDLVKHWVNRWKVDDWLKDLLPMASETWSKKDITYVWKRIEEQLVDRPFNDLGGTREARWFELGITWKATWSNDYNTTPAAEQLVAVLQILLADIAGVDLCLLKTDIDLEISVEDVKEPQIESISTNVGRNWKVTLPKYSAQTVIDIEKLQTSILTVAMTILAEVTLLSNELFFNILKQRFKNGLTMKVFVAKPYESLWREFVDENSFNSSNRQSRDIPQANRKFAIKENDELAWIDVLGPTYSEEKAKEYLQNRYERAIIPIKCTLRKLAQNSEFRKTVAQLRTEGWLDWHILCSIANIAVNYRAMKKVGIYHNPILLGTWFQILMDDPEISSTPTVPLSEFTEDRIRVQLDTLLISSLAIYDLKCHQRVPDFKAIAHFLKFRYNYFSDDIPHEDPFAIASTE